MAKKARQLKCPESGALCLTEATRPMLVAVLVSAICVIINLPGRATGATTPRTHPGTTALHHTRGSERVWVAAYAHTAADWLAGWLLGCGGSKCRELSSLPAGLVFLVRLLLLLLLPSPLLLLLLPGLLPPMLLDVGGDELELVRTQRGQVGQQPVAHHQVHLHQRRHHLLGHIPQTDRQTRPQIDE